MDKDLVIQKIKDQIKNLIKLSEDVKKVQKFLDVKTSDGKLLTTPADTLEVGVEILAVDEEGNQVPVEDGDFSLEDGTSITVKGGKVVDTIIGAVPKVQLKHKLEAAVNI